MEILANPYLKVLDFRLLRYLSSLICRLGGKWGSGVPRYGVRGRGSRGVQNRGSGGKHRVSVENMGSQWKTRGSSEKHGETIVSPNTEFSLLK